jgi:acetate---CoA ligase (ADP-forming) subunit beta
VASTTDRLEGFLLEEMVPAGHELVVGGVLDPQFGPMVMVGLGGIFVEVLGDVAFRICPITPRDAMEMLHELAAHKVLTGVRGGPVASEEAVVRTLLHVGGHDGILVDLQDEVAELDINPLIVTDTEAYAVDVRIVLTETPS